MKKNLLEAKQTGWTWGQLGKASLALGATVAAVAMARVWGFLPGSLWSEDPSSDAMSLAAPDNAEFDSTVMLLNTLPNGLSSIQHEPSVLFSQAASVAGVRKYVPANLQQQSSFTASQEFLVNTHNTLYNQQEPNVASMSDGGFVVSWTSESYPSGAGGVVKNIYAQRYDKVGSPLGNQLQVTNASQNLGSSQAVSLVDGSFVITWSSSDNDDGNGVYARCYNLAGSPLTEAFQVSAHRDQDYGGARPHTTSLVDGGFVVTWASNQYGDNRWVYAQRYNAECNRTGTEFRVNDSNLHTDYVSTLFADVSHLADGGFVVIWLNSEGEHYGDGSDIYAQRYDKMGVRVGDEFRVNTTPKKYPYYPHIASLTDGGFVVTWQRADCLTCGITWIEAQRYNATCGRVGSEFRVGSNAVYGQQAPSVTGMRDGGFMVSWANYNYTTYLTTGIFAQYYSAHNNQTSGAFQVSNSDAMYLWGVPSITYLKDGGFVIAWEADDPANQFYSNIYARRYAPSSAHNEPSQSPNPTDTAKMIGVGLGVGAGSLAAMFGIYCCYKTRRKKNHREGINAQGYQELDALVSPTFLLTSESKQTKNTIEALLVTIRHLETEQVISYLTKHAAIFLNSQNNCEQLMLALVDREDAVQLLPQIFANESLQLTAREWLPRLLRQKINEGRMSSVQTLIRLGANIDIPDERGVTARAWMARQNTAMPKHYQQHPEEKLMTTGHLLQPLEQKTIERVMRITKTALHPISLPEETINTLKTCLQEVLMSSLILTHLHVLEPATQIVAMRSLAKDIKDEFLHHANDDKLSIPAIKAGINGAVLAWKFNKLSGYQAHSKTAAMSVEHEQQTNYSPCLFSSATSPTEDVK